MQSTKTHLTPPVIADSLGVHITTVLTWIHAKELKASNIANNPRRPRWLVSKDDLQAFLDRRSNQQQSSDKPSKRRPKPSRTYV